MAKEFSSMFDGLDIIDNDQLHVPDIVPGFSSLYLDRINYGDDKHSETSIFLFEKTYETEHHLLHPSIKIMIALLKAQLPGRFQSAIQDLKDVLAENPHHLNALADLEMIYRRINALRDAEHLKQVKENILKGKSQQDIQNKATCLLEQAYILMWDRYVMHTKDARLNLYKAKQQLNTEYQKCSDNQKRYLLKGVNLCCRAICSVDIPLQSTEAFRGQTKNAKVVRLLAHADKLSSRSFQDPIWNFQVAIALSRYCNFLDELDDTDDRRDMLKPITIRSMNMFSHITANWEGDMQVYVARAYVHIGNILYKRKHYLSTDGNAMTTDTKTMVLSYVDNPILAYEKAYDLAPTDTSVLQRFAKALSKQSKQDGCDVVKTLQKSEKILTELLQYDEKYWYALATRMYLRKTISNSLRGNNERQKRYLELALADGRELFGDVVQISSTSLVELAEICQRLAKFPNTHYYGPGNITNNPYMIEALGYLRFGSEYSSGIDTRISSKMASCLFDLGEYENAVKWQRRACFICPNKLVLINATFLCTYLLRWYGDQRSRNCNSQINNIILQEVFFTMSTIKSTHSEDEMTSFIEKLLKFPTKSSFLNALEYLIESPLVKTIHDKTVLQDCVDACRKKRGLLSKHYLDKWNLIFVSANEVTQLKLEDVYIKPFEFLQPSIQRALSEGNTYDFFILYDQQESDWVSHVLLHQLEDGLNDEDIVFRGCIANRDFKPGISVLDNILEAIQNSTSIIVILTPEFVFNEWRIYNRKPTPIMRAIEKRGSNRVIPVIRQACEIPEELQASKSIEFTGRKKNIECLAMIKEALLEV